MKSFRTNPGGFQITLPNGLTLSTQIHSGAYCENRSNDLASLLSQPKHYESRDCEIAVFRAGPPGGMDEWLTTQVMNELEPGHSHDNVEGWVGIEQWLRILQVTEEYHR